MSHRFRRSNPPQVERSRSARGSQKLRELLIHEESQTKHYSAGCPLGLGLALAAVIGVVCSFRFPLLLRSSDITESVSLVLPVELVGDDPLPVEPGTEWQLSRAYDSLHPESANNLAGLSHLARLLYLYRPGNRTSPAASSERNTCRDAHHVRNPKAAWTIDKLLGSTSFGGEYFESTLHGTRYRTADSRLDDGEPHPGQALSALGESGVPVAASAVSSGDPIRVQDLVTECASSFSFSEEIEWRSVALALYRPHIHEWTTHRGSVVSFDLITEELLRRTRRRGSEDDPCWGTHTLYVLAVFLSVDARVPIWNDRSLRHTVEATLAGVAERLTRSQLLDGSWDQHWELPELARVGTSMRDRDRVLITGHHLEWISLMPDELRPPDRTLLAATGFVLRSFALVEGPEIMRDLCAYSHGLRAILLSGALNH